MTEEGLRSFIIGQVNALEDENLKLLASSIINETYKKKPMQSPEMPPVAATRDRKRPVSGQPIPVVAATKKIARTCTTEEVADYVENEIGYALPSDQRARLDKVRSALSRSSGSIRKVDADRWIHRSIKFTPRAA